jgi:glycosyltransferase involved in cell wall biosynthesis
MRIIYLHQYFNTPDMAGSTRSYEMARRLVAVGHEVHMVTTWREPTNKKGWFATKEGGIQVHWLPLPYSNYMNYKQRIKVFLKFSSAASHKAATLNGDVVFASSTPLTIAIPAIYASWRNRVPMVFEIRDLWPDVPIAMGVLKNPMAIVLARMLERVAYKRAAAIVALAPGMKLSVCSRGIAASKVHVIPNGCDFDVFNDHDVVPAALPGSDANAKAVVYIGAMGVANGIDFIPQLAFEIRRQAGHDILRFYLIGDGSQRPAVEALAEKLGVLNSSVFFIGQLPKREVARWLASAAATIMTYDGPESVFRDSVSNKFFDSLAARKPVIANFSGFSTLTAVEAGAGFIISPAPAIAAKSLLELLKDPKILTTAGDAAFTLGQQRFSRAHLAKQLEAVLRSVVDGKMK